MSAASRSQPWYVPYGLLVSQVVARRRAQLMVDRGRLAARLGVEPSELVRLENGTLPWQVEQLLAVAETLGHGLPALLAEVDALRATVERHGHRVVVLSGDVGDGWTRLPLPLLRGLAAGLPAPPRPAFAPDPGTAP